MTQASPLSDDRDDRLHRALEERDALAGALEASREREAALAGHLQHRFRNMLALIRSIFSRTVEIGDTLEHVATHFPGRLDTVARYQTRSTLQSAPDFDLHTMICDELMIFAAVDDPRVTVAGPAVRLGWQKAEALALALHELTANAIKFGALSEPDGPARLAISWTVADDWLTFDWIETGVPVVAPAPLPRGFGREYIELGLAYQIDAETAFEIVAGGVRCRIALMVDAGPKLALT